MSEATAPVKAKKKSTEGKWTRAQALGFWFLLTAVTMFWSGVYIGGVNTENYHKDIEAAKSSVVIEESASEESVTFCPSAIVNAFCPLIFCVPESFTVTASPEGIELKNEVKLAGSPPEGAVAELIIPAVVIK